MMMCICYEVRIQPSSRSFSSPPILSTPFLQGSRTDPVPKTWYPSSSRLTLSWRTKKKKTGIVRASFLPVDPWAPNIDSQSIATQLFAASLFPYIGFLYFITKSKSAPKLTLFGFYFLLAFVGATIPAGIYAKVHYGTSLSNVDWLHGGAESLLTLTNLFIVLGLRAAIRKAKDGNASTSNLLSDVKEKQKPSI